MEIVAEPMVVVDPGVVVVNMVVLKVTAELLVDKARLGDGCTSCGTG